MFRWWAFGIAQMAAAMFLVAFAASEAFQRLFLRVIGVGACGGALVLTFVLNLTFSKAVNGDAPADMKAIYFNLALNGFGVLVALVCSASGSSSKTKGH